MAIPHSTASRSNLYIKNRTKSVMHSITRYWRAVFPNPKAHENRLGSQSRFPGHSPGSSPGAQRGGCSAVTVSLRHGQRGPLPRASQNKDGFTWGRRAMRVQNTSWRRNGLKKASGACPYCPGLARLWSYRPWRPPPCLSSHWLT